MIRATFFDDTTAVRDNDGTVTLTVRQDCGSSDVSFLEELAGRFGLTARYSVAHEPIIEGRWKLSGIDFRGE